MNRPKFLHVGGTLFWVIRTRNPDTQVLKDADSTPTVAIRKNGASTADSVTVTKRTSTTGIYDCSYNPASEVEGDQFTVEESVTITGTTTGSATYSASWEFTVNAPERGTDSAALAAGVNVTQWGGTAVASAGFVADITTLLNRLTSTRAGNLDLLDVAISTLQSQISALNNLSAKANWFGNYLLEIPDSGTRAYVYELVIKDDEDKLVNLDALPTITLTNAAGTDRSALITTGIANTATGRYTLTITVGTSTTNEALTLRATGAVSAETRYAVWAMQVVDYDSAVLINSIYTRIGAPTGASIAADIAASKTVIDSIKTDTGTTIPGLFTTLTTKVRKFFQLIARKDTAIATDNATELSELNANGGSGAGAYSQTTDSLEAIRDRGDAAWLTGGGGGGGGDATLANQELILDQLDTIETRLSTVTVSVTGYASLDPDGNLLVKRGVTHTLTFTSSSSNVVSDLSAGDTKVFFGIKDTAGRTYLTCEGSVLVATGLQSVRFALTPAQAKAIPKGVHLFDVIALYGYTAAADAEPDATYTGLQLFASGRVTVEELNISLSDV